MIQLGLSTESSATQHQKGTIYRPLFHLHFITQYHLRALLVRTIHLYSWSGERKITQQVVTNRLKIILAIIGETYIFGACKIMQSVSLVSGSHGGQRAL